MNTKVTIEFKYISDANLIALSKFTKNIEYLDILKVAQGNVTEADNMFSALLHLNEALTEAGYTSE